MGARLSGRRLEEGEEWRRRREEEEEEEREREMVREGREEEGGRGRRERRKLRATLRRVVSVWTSHEPGAQVEKQLWRMDGLPYLLYSLH